MSCERFPWRRPPRAFTPFAQRLTRQTRRMESGTPMPKSPLSYSETPGKKRPGTTRLRASGGRARCGCIGRGRHVLTAAVAFAATNWTVSLNSGSSGEAQSGDRLNLTIAAVASPAAGNLLFPGGNGDVVATITNPNAVAVTVTAVQLPTNTTYASGFTTSALARHRPVVLDTTSDVLLELRHRHVGIVPHADDRPWSWVRTRR